LDGNSSSILDKWQDRVRYLRKLAKGWSANFEASIRRQKKGLMEEYDLLDIKSESQILSVEENSRFNFILNDLRSGSLRKQKLSKGQGKYLLWKGIGILLIFMH
jgi:hypothetical protein